MTLPKTQIPPPLPPSVVPESSTTWWHRNWKWCAPVACLGALVIITGFIAVLVLSVFGMMKSSGAYKNALAIAKANPAVETALGAPIEDGFLVAGNINIQGSSGHADLAIPISGPSDRATLYVKADKSAGQWVFSTLVVEIKTSGEKIDLLGAGPQTTL